MSEVRLSASAPFGLKPSVSGDLANESDTALIRCSNLSTSLLFETYFLVRDEQSQNTIQVSTSWDSRHIASIMLKDPEIHS